MSGQQYQWDAKPDLCLEFRGEVILGSLVEVPGSVQVSGAIGIKLDPKRPNP